MRNIFAGKLEPSARVETGKNLRVCGAVLARFLVEFGNGSRFGRPLAGLVS